MDFKPFAGLSQEDTAAMTLYYLALIAEKLPRTDANDRMIINGSEVAALATTLTSVADITRLGALGSAVATAKPTDALVPALMMSGAAHIYNNIIIS